MLSAVIPPVGRQPAMLLAEQLAHESYVHPGPLVLGIAFLKYLPAAEDRDRTVSRRSKPSSRTALMGEQPNPWDLLQPGWRESVENLYYLFVPAEHEEEAEERGEHKGHDLVAG